MPPESIHGCLFSKPANPTVASNARARASYCARSDERRLRCGCTISSGNITLPNVSRHGRRVGFWKAMPVIFSGPVTGAPATRIVPSEGGQRPVASFMNEDFPQPDGPTMAANWPFSMVRSTPDSASVPFASP
jgi:hypothetical protein